jgi:hypothetical protein
VCGRYVLHLIKDLEEYVTRDVIRNIPDHLILPSILSWASEAKRRRGRY